MAATTSTTAPTTHTGAACAGLCVEAGFTAVYRAHSDTMLRRAHRRLGDREQAEDAVQETFVRAWRACSSFRAHGGPPIAAWLSTILGNVIIDMIRARAVRPQPAWDESAEPADVAASPIDSADLRLDLLDALAGVSEDHRGVVLQAIVHDRPYAEVAAELGVPVGTVKSRVYYALRGMRRALEVAA